VSFCLLSFLTTTSAICSISFKFFRFFVVPNPFCSGIIDVSESDDVSEESAPRPIRPENNR